MSLLLVKDSANSKLRELECDTNGLLKVDKVDVSSLATESSLSGLNGKVTACDTGSISGTVAVSAVSGNVACTHAALPLPSGAATESSLSGLNGKVTACDTGSISGTVAVSAVAGNVACTHTALPLPSGASTASLQGAANSSLADLAGCVSGTTLSVSAGTVSSTGVYVWGSSASTASISGSSSANSAVVDCNGFSKVCIAGNSSNISDSNIEIEVSINNSEFFELNNHYISIDYNSGQFGIVIDSPFRYLRLKRSNTQMASENIKAVIAGK